MRHDYAKNLAIAATLWIAAAAACSQATRHRVLTFFIDGVPEPGAVPQKGYAIETTEFPGQPQAAARRIIPASSHAPFRENRCAGCHNSQDGQVLKSAEEGLCVMCHAGLTQPLRYLHGPVAVNACALCHHHHSSSHPKLLLDEPLPLCLQCHDSEDLSTGPHHPQPLAPCTACHDPHGGNDRFFLTLLQP